MQTMWKITLVLLGLLTLAGCQANDAAEKANEEADEVKNWLMAEEPNYDIVDVIYVKDGLYVLLTTFTKPGVDHYTILQVYIVAADDGSYAIKGSEGTYGADGTGFSAELLGTDDVTVLFGHIGGAVYDFEIDGMRDVSFTEVVVKLSDGKEVAVPVENHAPYIVIMDAGVEVSDIVYKTEDGDILYSYYYSEPLDASSSNS